ncbi:calcium-binding protein [Cognatiyoonia sp. IB215446]|uniref:calcium-binding protein n=1 Tax=Cognatiyoonia sp. IB215446 TaxID=3097355 RepID=UPI002A101D00|nr:calcium-binding protein [Cognatiyoonia sp. IB215446]MDX8347099.1 calcium-binding protein [Cognatiyoonia sp. IB215446]
MDITLLLALLGLSVLVIPALGGDDDGDDDELNEINGTSASETLNGTDGDDLILGFAGDDTINGLGGNDTIRGGAGNDAIDGGDGRDFIFGFDGNDTINGGDGADKIQGGEGNDRIDGGRNADDIDGGPGNDTLLGGAPAVRGPDGEPIIDTLRRDDVDGDDGDDTIFIWGGRGEAEGGEGDDTLVLVTGQGTLSDEFGGDTDFVILANAQDETIPTRGTITEFNPAQDTLTLTVDGDLGGGDAPEVEFVLREETRLEGSTPVSGIFVLAQIVDGEPDVAGSEGAGVFLRGATLAGLEDAEINVVFTDNADYFDPISTLEDVQDQLAAT